MDRRIIYPGAIPLETDVLFGERAGVEGLGRLATMLFGFQATVDGMIVTPNSPPGLSVLVEAGTIYFPAQIDATAYSTLTADGHGIMQQGILADPVALTITPPATPGQSRVYLVQVTCQVVDGNPVVLPYYNAADPTAAFSGPGNSGTAQNTTRAVKAIISLKAGTAAATGSQVTPSADSGYLGIATVTVANGATTIISGNIGNAGGGPRQLMKLPDIQSALQTLIVAGGLVMDPSVPGQALAAVRAVTPTTINVAAFTSSGTYTPSAKMLYALAEAVGGGGGGGSPAGGAAGGAGGGGGSGASVRKWLTRAAVGASRAVAVGAGGLGALTAGDAGAGGNPTTLVGIFTANGGAGGGGAANGVAAQGGTGGAAGGGDVNVPGEQGAQGTIISNAGIGGAGGSNPLGNGGPATGNLAGAGASGTGYGSGGAGGGASTTYRAGGDGAPGWLIIVEFCGS